VVAVEHLPLLGVLAERVALLPERIDAGKQRCVEVDLVAVAGEQRRDLALHRLQRLIGVGRGEMEEDGGHAVKAEAACLQRHDRVGEARCLLCAGDGSDRLPLCRHSCIEGREEVLRRDPVEGRQAEAVPWSEQRVLVTRAGHGLGCPDVAGKAIYIAGGGLQV